MNPETPAEYAQRRANETGKAYLVDAVGCAMVADAWNRQVAETTGGGIAAVYRPNPRTAPTVRIARPE